VKAIAGGRVSQHLVRKVRAGDYLAIGLPQGEFVLPDALPVAPLFVSAGSGITPFRGMLRSLIARERLPDVTHLHYAPRLPDVIFGEELQELAERHPRYRLHLVSTRDASHEQRRFHRAQLEAVCPDWRKRDAYACGPQSMLDAIEGLYREAGLSRQLHVERFLAATVAPPADVMHGRVRFARSKVEAKSNGTTSLLRIAEDAGLNPAHGCRMGICHACDATLKSGCVRDLRTNALLQDAGQKVQICVCAAAGDAELEL
jgi:ferredoxin-NADP reductase